MHRWLRLASAQLIDIRTKGAMARYLLAASPLAGHVMPMLRIAADLHDRGHHVTMLTGARYHDSISSSGVHAIDLPLAGQPSAQRGRSVGRAWLPSLMNRLLAGRAEMRSVFIEPMAAQYQALLGAVRTADVRSEEHTSELQSQFHLVCRLLLEKKKK